MTIIAGYVDHTAGCVHLAADSTCTGGGSLSMPVAKLVDIQVGVQDRAIIGIAGSVRMLNVVRDQLKLDAAPDDTSDADCDRWAQAVAVAFTELAFEHRDFVTGDDRECLSEALLAWRGRLWELTTFAAVPVRRYHAIGSGAAVGMGAMWMRCRGDAPAGVVESAVAAAIVHVSDVDGPIQSMST